MTAMVLTADPGLPAWSVFGPLERDRTPRFGAREIPLETNHLSSSVFV